MINSAILISEVDNIQELGLILLQKATTTNQQRIN